MQDPIIVKNKIFKHINPNSHSLIQMKTLIVGVGGIGCEILKNLCKIPIGTVHIIDMDTIELSNLNRQFLFKKEHKGMSKSLVAKQSILKINPNFDIMAHHKNIKQLPINFFKQFNFLIMALDNIQARNYVNKIGIRLNIPIIDAGTLGYKGNVTTIIPNQTRCYSCEPKSSNQKQFPVCTIRMRPEKPIHCIVWAKLLFQVMFGIQNQDNDLKDLAQLVNRNDIKQIMTKLFQTDILQIKNAKQDSDNKLSEIFAKSIKVISQQEIQSNISTKLICNFNNHQKKLQLHQQISIFSQSFSLLYSQKQNSISIQFQKDDDTIIHFISSASNLRMYCFNIQLQSFNEVKNMAGNIVPAIASTNSIVSGIEIVEMVKLVMNSKHKMRTYFVQNQANKVIPLKIDQKVQACQVCNEQNIPLIIQLNFQSYHLQDLVKLIKQKSPQLQQFSINWGQRQIYNSQQPKQHLLQKSILQLCSTLQVDFIITNQDTMKKVCTVWLIHNQQMDQPQINNQYQLKSTINQECSANQDDQKQNVQQNNDQESDIIMFDDQDSPDIQIIQVKKTNVQAQLKTTIQYIEQPSGQPIEQPSGQPIEQPIQHIQLSKNAQHSMLTQNNEIQDQQSPQKSIKRDCIQGDDLPQDCLKKKIKQNQ